MSEAVGEEHTIDRLARWHDEAQSNIDTWGNQHVATLVLAMVEELGEVADELLYQSEIGTVHSEEARQARELLQDISGLGIRTRAFLEETFESPAGRPETDPAIDGRDIATRAVSAESVLDEVNDLAPLVLQTAWALEEERGGR